MADDGATDEKPGKFVLPDGRTALCRGSDRLILTPALAPRTAPVPEPRSTGPRGAEHPRALYDEAARAAAIELKTVWKRNNKQIAAELGCHRKSVARWLKDAGLD